MAEFDNPTALVEAADAGAAGRLPQDGRLLADSDRGAGRGARPAAHAAAAARAARRHPRRARRLRPRGTGRRSIAYPMNIGGRPLNSWPQFIPVTFETTVLGAALTVLRRHVGAQQAAAAVSPGVQRAGVRRAPRRDRFFLCIEADRSAVRSRTTTRRFSRACTRRSVRSCAVGSAPPSSSRAGALAVVRRVRSRAGAACRQDMHDAPRYEPLEASTSSPTAARRACSSPTPSRAASCARTTHLYTGKVERPAGRRRSRCR